MSSNKTLTIIFHGHAENRLQSSPHHPDPDLPEMESKMQIPHLLPKLFGGLALLLSGLAQASALQISLVRSIHGGSCQDAIVRNLTSTTLQITLNYVIKGTDGSYYSGSAPIGGTTFNGGANTGYYMTLAPLAVKGKIMVGVSGGEEGALKGPSIMPGGSKEGWEALAPIYTKIAAIAEGDEG